MSAVAASAIPNIFGGFAPFPNTIATALLAYQSEAIGYGFGIKFQYAKRKIGAMTNEEFNALSDFTLGQIVEAHTTELTNRMISEMPRWIEIQKHYIEAGVTVEVMKANRTPSAWAEIIQSFTGAAGQQIVASINGLNPEAKSSILALSPILALIFFLSNQTSGDESPPETDDPTNETHNGSFTFPELTLQGSVGNFTFTTAGALITYTNKTCADFDNIISELETIMATYVSLKDTTFPTSNTAIASGYVKYHNAKNERSGWFNQQSIKCS